MTATEAKQKEDTARDVNLDTDTPLESGRRLEVLRKASKISGRSTESIFWEILRLTFGKSKLTDTEYFKYRLYDDKQFTPEQKRQVIGRRRNRKLNMAINPSRGVLHILDHKLFIECLLRGFGIAGTNTIACFVAQERPPSMGNMNLLRDRADLAAFLGTAPYPIFGKPLFGSLSLGTAGLAGYDSASEMITLLDATEMSLDHFYDQIFKNYYGVGFLFQEKITMHPDLQPYTGDAVGCFRIVTCKTPQGIVPLYAVWKIPGAGSMADNFWRDSKLALIDPETGQVSRCQVGSGVEAQELEAFPENGLQIKGLEIPDWSDVIELAVSAASLLSDASIAGFDIAHSDTGPRIIEVNANPDHGLYQIASGCGLLTPERQAIFDWNIATTRKNALAFKKRKRQNARNMRKESVKKRFADFKSDVASLEQSQGRKD